MTLLNNLFTKLLLYSTNIIAAIALTAAHTNIKNNRLVMVLKQFMSTRFLLQYLMYCAIIS